MSAGISCTAGTITTNGTYATIQCQLPTLGVSVPQPTLTKQQTTQIITGASYYITAGTGVTAGTVTFFELGLDGTWRPLASPAPVSTVFATSPNYNGAFTGQFHGLQAQVTGLTGGNLTYLEIKGTTSSP
jgi:hypothetical protein